MKFTKLYFAMIGLLIAFGLQSCNNSETSIVDKNLIEGNNSRVQLILVDAPGDYLEVNVNIIDVQYNSSEDNEGWRSFESFDGPTIVDLTELIVDNSLLLTDEIIESGMLKQIRLVLGDDGNTLVVDEGDDGEIVQGSPIELKTPSAQQSGLKIKLDAELESGFSYTYILDWDVQKSIVKAGNSGQYILKPVINASAEVNSGSIAGNVVDANTDPMDNVEVEVYLDGIYVTSSMTNIDGDFLIQGLDPTVDSNGYILKISHTGFEEYMTEEVDKISVTAGEITHLSESIVLLLPKSIIGKVIDTDGDVEGAMVDVFSTLDDTTSLGTFTTSSDGSFFFRGLAAGDFVLKIIGPDGDDEGTESDYKPYMTSTAEPDETITVNDGETTDVENIEIVKL